MPERTIYKIVTHAEWEAAQAAGVYRGSAHDLRDGFIHFSTAAQLAGTARKYFSGVPNLVLLAADSSSLSWPPPEAAIQSSRLHAAGKKLDDRVMPGHDSSALRWEPARGGDLFPHLYGDLPVSAVKCATSIPLGEDGTPMLPGGVAP